MGKAFVAKLAKEGARDPEALAAWIGRKKHGKGAFQKLVAAGRKKQRSEGAKVPSGAAKKTASAPKRAVPRDMNRGFRPGSNQFALSDSDVETLRDRAKFNRQQLTLLDIAGATDSAAEKRAEIAEQERQIADAEYARETAAGQRAYSDSVQAERTAVNEALRKARSSNDPADWAAAADAAEAFSRRAEQSPYGAQDAGWYRAETQSARESADAARRAQERQEVRKRERTLPPPKPGETPIAHVEFLDSEDGNRSFGDPEMGRKAITRSSEATAMPDTGAEGHAEALKNVSPAFRKKVADARASGRPWLHHISHDSGGAEIHKLQVMTPDGKQQTTTFLERNTKAWKAKEERKRRSGR
jgi:hypothetical protein